jgi:hypothetical protein
MNEDRLRLIKLVEHWIDHNDEHGKRFREEAESAEKLKLKMVAAEMMGAVEASEKVSECLLRALNYLKESDS